MRAKERWQRCHHLVNANETWLLTKLLQADHKSPRDEKQLINTVHIIKSMKVMLNEKKHKQLTRRRPESAYIRQVNLVRNNGP